MVKMAFMRKGTLHPKVSDIADSPIRGEIFSAERLEEYARYLAEHLKTEESSRPRRDLLRRMRDNGNLLLQAYKSLVAAANTKEAMSPAGEWLIDNFHIIEEQLREIDEDLPVSYYTELPRVSMGELSGYPRIYALALALVAHSDSRLELSTIRGFVESFQQKSYLSIGELWAFPIALRLALVENLRRVAVRIVWDRNLRVTADDVTRDILAHIHDPVKWQKSIAKISVYCGRKLDIEAAFIAQMATRLRDQESDVWPAFEYLEKVVQACGHPVEEIVNLDHQHQAGNQVTIANIISSMRLLSNIDWRDFYESVSLLDRDLARDPSGHYTGMSFETQDEYRHVIERISKRTKSGERVIVEKALQMAGDGNQHIGYFLKGPGLQELERAFKYHPQRGEIFSRFVQRWPTLFYLLSLGLLNLSILAASVVYVSQYGLPLWKLVILIFAMVIPTSDLAVSLFNFILTHLLHPQRLAKMDFSDGVPRQARTLVIIPCMLSDPDTVSDLLQKLEVHYLGNSDAEIYFALVTDFNDATTEALPQDDGLVELATSGIQRMNQTYAAGREGRFFLFHRRRQWNESEQKWMGWERKRGKIEELNHLLRGSTDTSFVVATMPESLRRTFKYVITLDADTRMGLDTAKKMIGTASHPLNIPRVDEQLGRVVQGYGIIQPRISISLESSSASTFAAIFSGHTGIDPYTTAVSDVYQDLFQEGSFTGKGLYDIDVFERVLQGRVPENTVLSHDLFEGLYARTGLATDIELLDDYPANYRSYIQRQHRWVRGDWQIARWISPIVPNAGHQLVVNRLPLISRWKIHDNLRRSLVTVSLFILYLAGWIVLPEHENYWTAFSTLIIALPCFLHVANGLLMRPGILSWTSGFWSEMGRLKISLGQFLLSLVFLPHKAYVECDAIVRALFRTRVSKRKCLEWVPSAQVDKGGSIPRKPLWQKEWPVEIFLLGLTAFLFVKSDLITLRLASPFLILWLSFPLVNKWTGRRIRRKVPELEFSEKFLFLQMARRIWGFFENFVGPEDNWLPPDNVQEDPKLVVAHRTSPTNIGLYGLSVLAARDLGFLGFSETERRLRDLLATINRLEKYQGHLLNWYDTKSLTPLYPKYVSCVDSGNLAGYLLTIRQGLGELASCPLVARNIWQGMLVTLMQIEEELLKLQQQKRSTSTFGASHIYDHIQQARKLLNEHGLNTLPEKARTVRMLNQNAADIDDSVSALELEHGVQHYQELRRWVSSLNKAVKELIGEFRQYAPWALESFRSLEASLIGRGDISGDAILDLLRSNPAVKEWPAVYGRILQLLNSNEPDTHQDFQDSIGIFAKQCRQAIFSLEGMLQEIEELRSQCQRLFDEMDFSFLLNHEREVFSIGFNVTEARSDNAYYDLLASEARLASFVAILKGDVVQRHWFRLGRQLVAVEGNRALVSWSASMFEYLMPQLVMKNFESTLLSETMQAVVARQISYGRKMKVPWGISESGYNARDLNFNYQYGPFGIPGLGLKRGLGHDLVVSPYSTFLAALVDPKAAIKNLQSLSNLHVMTGYGFYEAIDYTPDRLSPEQSRSVIRSYMAHHQGMSLVAVDNVLHGNIMQERFHSDPRVRAAQLLLQERIPQRVQLTKPKAAQIEWEGIGDSLSKAFIRHYENVHHDSPRVQVLSNGRYSLSLSTAGGGYSLCNGLALTRWREDSTRDHWGSYLFIRDLTDGKVWSATYQPCLTEPEQYRAVFAEDKVEFFRLDGSIQSHTQVIVAPEDDVELRQVSISNNSYEERIIELTSYLEPVLAAPAEDMAHPAFANLFLQTEYVPTKGSLLVRRRPRSSRKNELWGFHCMASDTDLVGDVEYETDRARFLGRGRNLLNPAALEGGSSLSQTVGSPLDPVLSLRLKVRVAPGETAKILFSTGMASSKDQVLQLADRYHDVSAFERESHMAWTKSKIDLRHLGLDAEDAYLFQRLAERILFSDPSLRRPSHVLSEHTREQSSLWPYGISGDLPMVVLMVDDVRDLGMLRKLLRGHEYLRLKGVVYDFVILNDSRSVYLQDLHEEILRQVRYSGAQGWLNKSGGIFAIRMDLMPEQDRSLIPAMAHVVLSPDWGTLKEQIAKAVLPAKYPPAFTASQEKRVYPVKEMSMPELKFFNGLGGFSDDGREYVIGLGDGQWTPAPWINVIANQHDFGFQVSEAGAGFTWSVNSRENRLTSWSNDPVSDPSGEVFYLRDEDTGEIWTPTPAPVRGSEMYLVRHGQGYSVFESNQKGMNSELTMFVAADKSVKISRLKIKNLSGVRRRISVWAYVEWVMGTVREKSLPHIFTESDEGILFAKNPYNREFSERISFFKAVGAVESFTCDRKEFIGRNGDLSFPQALRRQGLSGRTGVGMDPCAAVQQSFEIEEGAEIEVIFLLGQAESKKKAKELASDYQNVRTVDAALAQVKSMWDDLLGGLQVKTPDDSLNFLMNRWLLYQTLACRMWARSAFYQSGGAYGFRDQLQDCMAFAHVAPHLARAHILRAAAHQFPEGDVQHWWHPPTGRGVRTHFSDDLLWLPLVVSHYVRISGDREILQEKISFIEAPLLTPDQEDSYTQPQISDEKTSLLDHCLRAIEHSQKFGVHGLPLIGSGDWNDGMNRVGEKGRGESVWMAWFLHRVMEDFLPFCDQERSQRYRQIMASLKKNVEESAWDGDWYRRAYFDDGQPIGSKGNEECRIDSLSQSWSVLSGAGQPERQRKAMQSVSENLIQREKGIVLLLTPPFDRTPLDPGYIKGYVPGVRENGGQYTHAALWVLMAFAKLGDRDRVTEIMKMLNPIHHARNRAGMQKYKIEPFVIAADIYAVPPHVGRGGWSWYTGSASWFYRAYLESVLGVIVESDRMLFKPCVPSDWRVYEVQYRHKSTIYQIIIEPSSQDGVFKMRVSDGEKVVSEQGELRLVDDGTVHRVTVRVIHEDFAGRESSSLL